MVSLSTLALAAANCTLLLGGDVMLNAVAPTPNVWKHLEKTVKAADAAFANLEIPLTDARNPTPLKSAAEIKAREQFVLKASPSHAPLLAKAGWDVVSLANNHAMDYRAAGLDQMRSLLRKAGIGYAGAGSDLIEAAKPAVFRTANGTTISLLSMMAFVGPAALQKTGPATASGAGVFGMTFGGVIDERARERLRKWIAEAAGSDLIVVAMHWGRERQKVPTGYQVALARALVDEGVDIVWGHHPHVLQGAELYRGKPILYSTGNLVSPLPGETALFRFRYVRGRLEGTEVLPAQIAKGSVSLLLGDSRLRALGRFASLNTALLKAYPNPRSQPLTK